MRRFYKKNSILEQNRGRKRCIFRTNKSDDRSSLASHGHSLLVCGKATFYEQEKIDILLLSGDTSKLKTFSKLGTSGRNAQEIYGYRNNFNMN